MEPVILRDPSDRRQRLALVAAVAIATVTVVAFTWIATNLSLASPMERIGIWLLGVVPMSAVVGYWTWRNLSDGVEVHVDRLVVRTGRKRIEILRTNITDIWISIFPDESARWNGAWMVRVTAAGIDHWLRVLRGGHRSARSSRPDYLERVATSLRHWTTTGTFPDPSGGRREAGSG